MTDDKFDSLEAELDELKATVQRLKRHDRHASYASDRTITQEQIDADMVEYDTDFDMPVARESAAARLQKRHERSTRAPTKQAAFENRSTSTFEAECFPTLGKAPMIEYGEDSFQSSEDSNCSPESSYASIARDVGVTSTARDASLARTRYGQVSCSPDGQDRDWVMLDQRQYDNGQDYHGRIPLPSAATSLERPTAGRGALHEHGAYTDTRESYENSEDRVSPTRQLLLDGAPRFATAKRATDGHRRKALPEQWAPERDVDRRHHHAREDLASLEASHAGVHNSTIAAPRKTLRGSHRGRVLTYDDEHEQVSIRHDQPAHKSARMLAHAKSHGSLVSPSKGTVGRASTFASPTAASKQRSAILTKPGKSPSPTKSIDTSRPRRQDIAARPPPLRITENHVPNKKPVAREYTHAYNEGPYRFPDFLEGDEPNPHMFTLAQRDALHDTSTDDFVAAHHKFPPILGSPLNTETLSWRGKMNKPWNIKIPSPARIQSRSASPSNNSKIPRLAQKLSTPPASPMPTPQPLTAIKMTHRTLERTKQAELGDDTPRASSPSMTRSMPEQPRTCTPTLLGEEIPPTPLTGERAALLQPIVRRLSSAESQRLIRSRSSTLNGSECSATTTATLSIEEHKKDTSSTQSSQRISEETVSYEPTVHVTAEKADTPSIPQPASPELQPLQTINPATKVASSSYPSTVQQISKDDAKHQGQDPTEGVDPSSQAVLEITRLTSPLVGGSNDLPRSHEAPPVSSPEQDPAIIKIGPIASSSLGVSKAASFSSKQNSRAYSLRATASEFVPRSSSVTPTQQATIAIPLTVTVGPRTDVFSPVTPLEQKIPSLISPPCTDETQRIPHSDWISLTPSERQSIREKRLEQGSSDESTSGLSKLTFGSALSPCQSFASESPDKDPRHFDWFDAARKGPAVRFARAPLPSMDEEVETEVPPNEKGWDIGSATPGWWYGWRGGDGLEISFVGHGPDAERFPDAPVEFRKYKANKSSKTWSNPSQQTPTHNQSHEGDNGISVATQDMREWATEMGYNRTPCGNFDVTHAVEHIGNGSNHDFVDGWCHNCVPPH